MDTTIIYLGLCLSILFGIIYIRNPDYRYWLVILYLLLLMYGYYNIDKKISLGALLVFIIAYLFIGKKPEFKNMEHYKDHEPEHNKDGKNEKFENNDSHDSHDSHDSKETYENTKPDDKKSIDEKYEHLEEKGIEQFGLSDKFSQLHTLIHQMEKHNKLK